MQTNYILLTMEPQMNSGTGISITAAASTKAGYYVPASYQHYGGSNTFNFNFGNGYFGTTAVNFSSRRCWWHRSI